MMLIVCAYRLCRAVSEKPAGAVNRARLSGAPIYCSRLCAGLGRRKHKTKDQKVAEKAAYDRKRRELRREELKAEKAAYHKRTYDPVKAAEHRKTRMPYHVEYCRRPEVKAKKVAYDRERRAQEYGPFADAYKLLLQIDNEVNSRMSDYDVRIVNGTINKRQKRKRKHEQSQNGQL